MYHNPAELCDELFNDFFERVLACFQAEVTHSTKRQCGRNGTAECDTLSIAWLA